MGRNLVFVSFVLFILLVCLVPYVECMGTPFVELQDHEGNPKIKLLSRGVNEHGMNVNIIPNTLKQHFRNKRFVGARHDPQEKNEGEGTCMQVSDFGSVKVSCQDLKCVRVCVLVWVCVCLCVCVCVHVCVCLCVCVSLRVCVC